ncbi:MAG: Tex family protein [Pseudomonadota bacterium]
MTSPIPNRLAEELNLNISHIHAVIALLDEGATVPFIARYRKDMTGAMDDAQLRNLHERLGYLRELDERRSTILNSIEQQGKLTDVLKTAVLSASTKTQLEDLYLPYKPKRRTKAQIAIEAGLEPLASQLFDDPSLDPEILAQTYLNVDAGINDTKTALDGALHILLERASEDASLLESLRQYMRSNASVISTIRDPDKADEAEKFEDYFEFSEKLSNIPSHRLLACLRGRNEGFLNVSIDIDPPADDKPITHPCVSLIYSHFNYTHQQRPADDFLSKVMNWTWQVKLNHQIESDLMIEKRIEAEHDAIKVFSANLKDLLLAAPAGPKVTMGLDPGFRSGVKVAVVDATGNVLDHCAIYPHPPQKQWDQALQTLANLCKQHSVELISIGNGTASRETDTLAAELLSKHSDIRAQKIMVSEAGASVYSASAFASQEFPDLDVTIRGAISIARRLQDPLSELVKIEPKAIGVGQYQHDVNQVKLSKELDAAVEDCVNSVGVDLNMASEPLLTRVSGLTPSTASNIVQFRRQRGEFKNRTQLLEVSRLGPKVFEQAAGFLRIMNGDNPLDASCVHPESYPVVESIAHNNARDLSSLIGDKAFLSQINPQEFVTESTGVIAVKDIVSELEKPGRDPRPEFKTAQFKDGVEKISDLKPGMHLEGVITNVANFGAFVDIGVHQDGLVHISMLSNIFVKDPRTIVKAGDIVKVKVLEVDTYRKRISLTMRLDAELPDRSDTRNANKKSHQEKKRSNTARQGKASANNNAMASALLNAMKKK